MALSGRALVSSREDERQRLGARRLAFLESAAHGAGGGGRAGLLHTAHAHAHVLGLQNHDHALRVQLLDQRVGDLRGQTLLHLRSFRERIHQRASFDNPQMRPSDAGMYATCATPKNGAR